ncbi:MAG: DUF3617 domain-containing protein [Gammaproteobacteria bacterium]
MNTRVRAPRLLPCIALLGGLVAAQAEEPTPAPGQYQLAVQLLMPNLEEMREITVRDERCLSAGEASGLFPVMRQPALHGCRLVEPRRGADGIDYVLQCQSARVATGSARVTVESDGALLGQLQVKMGGKNMTFSQHSIARRTGDCTPAG